MTEGDWFPVPVSDYNLALSGTTNPGNKEFAKLCYMKAATTLHEMVGPPRRIISGCAIGVDSDCAEYMLDFWSEFKVGLLMIAPAAPFNRDWVTKMRERTDIMTELLILPRGTLQSNAAAYMARNDELRDRADALAAFPISIKEQFRGSGTWATIRRFRNVKKPVMITSLDTRRQR